MRLCGHKIELCVVSLFYNLLFQPHKTTIKFYLDNSADRSRAPDGVCEVPGSENQQVHQDQQSHQAHQLDVSDDLRHKVTNVIQLQH